ncbi:MAG TPA: aminoglycoside phosphotransferase family protein [Sumerlaeia bacterium]|nr:aminoglycoside phosphotransferase family protein [Sumerlaeia bacterium]
MPDALILDQFLKRYVERRLPRLQGPTKGEVKMVVPLTGVMSLVRLIEVGGVPRAVIRVYPDSQADLVDRRLRADALVETHGLNAPRLIDVHESRRTGLVAIVEEYLQGTHPEPKDLDTPRVEALADAVAGLHAVRAGHFGPLGAESRGDFSAEARRMVRNRWRSVRRWAATQSRAAPAPIDGASRRLAKKWFRAFARRFADLKEFSLIHDKPNRGNLIFQTDPLRCVFVDLSTLRYGHPAKDLVQICHEILGGSARWIETFLTRYFAQAAHCDRADYEALAPFYHAYYHLGQCAINCRREAKRSGSLEHFERGCGSGERDLGSRLVAKSVDHWQKLLRVLEKHPLAGGEMRGEG